MSERQTTGSGLALTSAELEVPPMHIPDGTGGTFKTELVLSRSSESTHKVLWWHADDPREEPHNHPWYFESEILAGGYTDYRYWIDGSGEVQNEVIDLRTGDTNIVTRDIFHNVRDVLPGTRTRMTCGPAAPGNEWGYLNVETGEVLPFDHQSFLTDPPFIKQLHAANPHMAP